ncbi:hypothetical protein B0T13DRAFT_446874 [Neurospora crassa]|nr:hypothetical protein B0T13DRAFT_446874 [Neurospora crassa]
MVQELGRTIAVLDNLSVRVAAGTTYWLYGLALEQYTYERKVKLYKLRRRMTCGVYLAATRFKVIFELHEKGVCTKHGNASTWGTVFFVDDAIPRVIAWRRKMYMLAQDKGSAYGKRIGMGYWRRSPWMLRSEISGQDARCLGHQHSDRHLAGLSSGVSDHLPCNVADFGVFAGLLDFRDSFTASGSETEEDGRLGDSRASSSPSSGAPETSHDAGLGYERHITTERFLIQADLPESLHFDRLGGTDHSLGNGPSDLPNANSSMIPGPGVASSRGVSETLMHTRQQLRLASTGLDADYPKRPKPEAIMTA